MCKRNGEPLEGVEFFHQLYSHGDFCMHLGKVMLSASRLESELIRYLSAHDVKEKTQRANLGILIRIAKDNDLLEKMISVLKEVKDQRNYLSHNLHTLFTNLIDESVLPRSELLDSDIDVFTDHTLQLEENLRGLADIMAKYNENT